MSIRIRVYPQTGSYGARRRGMARLEQRQMMLQQRLEFAQQRAMMRQQQMMSPQFGFGSSLGVGSGHAGSYANSYGSAWGGFNSPYATSFNGVSQLGSYGGYSAMPYVNAGMYGASWGAAPYAAAYASPHGVQQFARAYGC